MPSEKLVVVDADRNSSCSDFGASSCVFHEGRLGVDV